MKLVECGDHLLDLQRIQAVDDVCGDYQHCNIWCHRHDKYEWQWLGEQRAELGDDADPRDDAPPGYEKQLWGRAGNRGSES